MRCGLLGLITLVAMGLVGCGSGNDAQPSAQSPAAGAASPDAIAAEQAASQPVGISAVEAAKQPSVDVPPTATPEQVVQTFLDALKQGDIATKASLLTQKAREETTKENFEINPQSTPNAEYRVEPAQYLADNPNGAHVNSLWTETYSDGKMEYAVVWVLRKQPEGWRIAGMAIELVEGQPPSFLNFEDAADMARKYEEAMAASTPPAAEVASQPDPATPVEARPIQR
jgi:hypothetical protein